MRDNQKIKRGTIYLRGAQSHFKAAITRALDLGREYRQLKYDISIDILQSLKNHELTYRVDYALER